MDIPSMARRISALSVRIVDRRRSRHDPPKRVRRHAEASRHEDAFDPRQLPQVRALAAGDHDPRLVDLLETQHVAAHPLTFLSGRRWDEPSPLYARGPISLVQPADRTGPS